jgi:tetratricopeptide (TPR) repeat protein
MALPSGRHAGIAVALYTLVLLAVTLAAHPTPLYFVETDLVGEYIPAARALASGRIAAEHHAFKGPGYPLLLALATPACGGDAFLAARVVSALATGAAAGLAFLLVRRFAGPGIAWFTLVALMLNPVFLRYAIEAGTDAPATALMLAATWTVLRARSAAGWLVAGSLAGFAVITRGNAACLIPAGALILARRPERVRGLALYLGAALLPSLAWHLLCVGALGHPIADRNYLNVAFELYGRDLTWERFEATIGTRFRSMLDVLAYDPLHAGVKILWNLGAHLASDLIELTPPWLGVLVPPGLVLAARRPAWRPALLHAGLCALALAPVFYSSRFSLYLLPFELAAAGVLLAAVPGWVARRVGDAGLAPARRVVLGVGAIGLVAGGVVGARAVAGRLAEAPDEIRAAAAWLRGQGLSGTRLMARKPHAAHFAGMEHVPMPAVTSVLDLVERARGARVRTLLFTPIELTQRPELGVLADSAVALPGLDPLRYAGLGGRRFFAVYRVNDAAVDSAAMAAAVQRAVLGRAERRPGDPVAQMTAAFLLLEQDRPGAARDRLLALERGGARDPAVAELLSNAQFALGDWRAARDACRRAMALTRPGAWHYRRLAEISEREGRREEALDWWERAVRAEPANLALLERAGVLAIELARYRRAALAFDRCVRLAPREARFRRYAMGAHQYLGDRARMKRIYEDGLEQGIAAGAMLDEAQASAPR